MRSVAPGTKISTPARCRLAYVAPIRISTVSTSNIRCVCLRWVADNFDIRKDITFKTEVKAIVWDEAARLWEIRAEGPDGPRAWRANAVIASVGFLSRPNMPDIEGMETFEGKAFHTARWPTGLDLKGKRVAVIGTGETGYQRVPELAKLAGHTYVFQRTPNWCFDTKSYLDPFPSQVNWLDRNFPYIRNFIRSRLSWLAGPQAFAPVMRIDPSRGSVCTKRPQPTDSRSAARVHQAQAGRTSRPDRKDDSGCTALFRATDHHRYRFLDLRRALTRRRHAGYRPNRAHHCEGYSGKGRQRNAADIIVYATGFKANDFLWPMEIRGREGKRIEELWQKDGARAYLGTMLSGFPNFFMIYGPNTNNFSGLQIVDFERWSHGSRSNISAAFAITRKSSTVDVSLDAYWRYNEDR